MSFSLVLINLQIEFQEKINKAIESLSASNLSNQQLNQAQEELKTQLQDLEEKVTKSNQKLEEKEKENVTWEEENKELANKLAEVQNNCQQISDKKAIIDQK